MFQLLTENNRQMFGVLDQFVLHFIGNLGNFRVTLLMHQPAEEFILFHQITLVDMWNTTFKEYNRWDLINTPFFGFLIIIDLDKGNIILIALIVDVFQFCEDFL